MAARKSRSGAKAARPTTVAAYLATLTPEKRAVIEEARAFVLEHIPKGYAEFMLKFITGRDANSGRRRVLRGLLTRRRFEVALYKNPTPLKYLGSLIRGQ